MTLPPEKYGVHFAMPAVEYHALPGASASQLRKLWQSTPAHLKASIDETREETAAMRLGTLAHALILEPEKPLPDLELQPDEYEPGKKWTYAAKACKEWKAKHEAAGRIILTRSEYDAIFGMARAIARHEIAASLFKVGNSEVSIVTQDTANDVVVRARLDFVPQETTFLADVKTTQSADVGDFTRKAFESGFHIQAALYLDLWNALTGESRTGFRFVVVEQKPPHCVNVFDASPEFIARGGHDYKRALTSYARCVHEDAWPGYTLEIQPLNLPKWADAR